MPSYSTSLLDVPNVLLRQQPLTPAEWLGVIAEYAGVLKPHLNTFTLSEFRTVECVRVEGGHAGRIGDAWESRGDRNFDYRTQGIFGHHESGRREIHGTGWCPVGDFPARDGFQLVWGYTRAATWMLAEVEFKGVQGYRARGRQNAIAVTFQQLELDKLLELTKIPPYLIFLQLHGAVTKWERGRRNLYATAETLKLRFDIAQNALGHMYRLGLDKK